MILRSELKQNAKNQLKNNWGLAIGIIIVCTLISCIPNLLVEINDESLAIAIIIPITTLVITGPLTIGQCKFFINLANRSNPKFSDLWYGFNTKGYWSYIISWDYSFYRNYIAYNSRDNTIFYVFSSILYNG